MEKILWLLRQKSYWEEKKCRYSQEYRDWVGNAWLNAFAINGIGVFINKNFFEGGGEVAKIIGIFCLILLFFVSFFIIYKICSVASHSFKIQKISQKIAQLDQQIIEELSKQKIN